MKIDSTRFDIEKVITNGKECGLSILSIILKNIQTALPGIHICEYQSYFSFYF